MGIEAFLNFNGSNPKLIEELPNKNLLRHIPIDVEAPIMQHIEKVNGSNKRVRIIFTNRSQAPEICNKFDIFVWFKTTFMSTSLYDEKLFLKKPQLANTKDITFFNFFLEKKLLVRG